MTYVNPVAPVSTRTSKACIFSLIFGFLGCIPFLGGFLAVILGFIGIAKTGNPQVTGRWMGVIGLILGLMSMVGWVFLCVMGIGGFTVFSFFSGPPAATHDFIRDLAAGDSVSYKAHETGLTDEELTGLSAFAKAHGTFKDSTMSHIDIVNDEAGVSGTAEFSGGTVNVEAVLKKEGGIWKIAGMKLKNP